MNMIIMTIIIVFKSINSRTFTIIYYPYSSNRQITHQVITILFTRELS